MSLSNVRRMFVAFNYQLKTERSYHKILKLHPFVFSHLLPPYALYSVCCRMFLVPYCDILGAHSFARSLSISVYILNCFDNKLENKLILSFNAWNPIGNLIGFINTKQIEVCLWKTGQNLYSRFSGCYTHTRSLTFFPLKMKREKLAANEKKGGLTWNNDF